MLRSEMNLIPSDSYRQWSKVTAAGPVVVQQTDWQQKFTEQKQCSVVWAGRNHCWCLSLALNMNKDKVTNNNNIRGEPHEYCEPVQSLSSSWWEEPESPFCFLLVMWFYLPFSSHLWSWALCSDWEKKNRSWIQVFLKSFLPGVAGPYRQGMELGHGHDL